MDGEKVEKVVPLAARDDTDGAFLGPNLAEDRELIDSVLLVVEIGLAISARSCRACSTACISFAARCIVESDAGPWFCCWLL